MQQVTQITSLLSEKELERSRLFTKIEDALYKAYPEVEAFCLMDEGYDCFYYEVDSCGDDRSFTVELSEGEIKITES